MMWGRSVPTVCCVDKMYPIEIELYKRYLAQMDLPRSVLLKAAGPAKPVEAGALVEEYDAFFFDAFGTLFNRKGYVYPGAREFIARLQSEGKAVRMVTNAATNTAAKVSADMQSMGFNVPAEHIFSSGRYVLEYQKRYGFKSVFYAGRPGGVQMLADFGIAAVEEPEMPVVAFCSTEPDAARLAHAEEILSRQNALLLILNPDACAPELDGSRSEVSGIQSYRIWKRTNCRFEICGKPFGSAFAEAIESVRAERQAAGVFDEPRILMVGDTLGTDVVGAYAAGLDSCLVLGRNVPKADYESDCEALGFRPTFVMEGF